MNFKKLPKDFVYDAIIIGSGLGGMCCAALLAKVNKKKVLVLEQHSEFGGCTHEFKRGPYSWDVGLHYIGDLEKTYNDTLTKKMFDYITDGNLKWNKMPKVFDRFLLPNMEIPIPAGINNYINTLIEKFPNDESDIRKYCKDIIKIQQWYLKYFYSNFFVKPISSFFKFLTNFNKDLALMTLGDYLEKNISNPKLRTVIAMRFGNYGLDPSKAAFATHALVEEHYYDGGCFPNGGAGIIGGYIDHVIECNGGTTITNAKVTEILLDNKQAYGVKVKDLASQTDNTTEYYAPIIVSDAGALNTYLRMLPESLNLDIQQKLKNYKTNLTVINVYFGLKSSPRALGVNGENIWINDKFTFDNFEERCDWINDTEKLPGYCFISFPSLKSTTDTETKIAHTADTIVVVPYKYFDKWKNEQSGSHSKDYYELKNQIAESITNLIEKYISGFKDLIGYVEVATPLTFDKFLNRYNGTIYGLPEYVERYKIEDLQVKTPIKNLYLTGTDVLSNGIVPAVMSGMGTAVHLNGFFGIIKIMSKATTFKPDTQTVKNNTFTSDVTLPKHSNKKIATLVSTEPINDNLLEVTFVFSEPIELQPGQHLMMNVALGVWRAYSVAKCFDNKIVLIIDTRPDGVGVNFIKNLIVGQKAIFRLPINGLNLRDNSHDKVLIGSGTGFVPFISMIDSLVQQKFGGKVTVLFGCLDEKDNFIAKYLDEYKDKINLDVHIYIENLGQTDRTSDAFYNIEAGRVTQFFDENSCDYKNTDFYLCGHPNMVKASVEKIRDFDGKNIYC